MRSIRTVRRVIASMLTIGALLLLPGAASAADDVTAMLTGPASPAEAGSTVNYTLKVTFAGGPTDNTATFSLDSLGGGTLGTIPPGLALKQRKLLPQVLKSALLRVLLMGI